MFLWRLYEREHCCTTTCRCFRKKRRRANYHSQLSMHDMSESESECECVLFVYYACLNFVRPGNERTKPLSSSSQNPTKKIADRMNSRVKMACSRSDLIRVHYVVLVLVFKMQSTATVWDSLTHSLPKEGPKRHCTLSESNQSIY